MAELATTGIEIALFSLFGSLVWENLGTRATSDTERGKARRSIRIMAKYFFYSFIVLLAAYLVDFAKDQTIVTTLFGSSFLPLFEGLVLFVGYLMFLPPLYALGTVLSNPDTAIGDITLPEVSKVLASGIVALFYFILLLLQVFRPPSSASRILGSSFAIALIAMLANFANLKGWKGRIVFWLILLPWAVLVALSALSSFGLISID
jgi:uncharacterized membrane protein YhaH (DUF805 family)